MLLDGDASLAFESNPNLRSISLGGLKTVGTLNVTNNPGLTTIDMPKVENIEDSLLMMNVDLIRYTDSKAAKFRKDVD